MHGTPATEDGHPPSGRPGDPANAESFAWLPPEGAGGRPPCRRQRMGTARLGRAARNSPPVTGGSMYLVWTFAVPGVDPRRTRAPFPPVLAVPGRRTAVVCKPFSPSCAARVWEAGGGCVLRADAVPALVRGRRAGGPGPRRACRLPVLCVLARERCPASAPWRGRRLDRHREDVATYRERVRRPRAGRFPASPLSRPASACPLPEGKAAGRVPGLRPGTVSRTGRPFSRIRQPAAIPRRQLICLLIRLPADSGAPFQRRTRWTRRE
jgi:hypothetical protein